MTLNFLENNILLGWDSLIADIICEYSKTNIVSGYSVNNDLEKEIEFRLNLLQKNIDVYFMKLNEGNQVEINIHIEFMYKESKDVLNEIDKNIRLIRNDKEEVKIDNKIIKSLLMVRKSVQNLITRIERF